MKLGAVFPQTEIGLDPEDICHFAITLEACDFDHVLAYDHVIGANTANRPEWPEGYYDHTCAFHEPLVLFSFLSGVTAKLEFMTGVMILPQRQTALVAKQAANLDVFSSGRLRMGFGVGWNRVEYEALGVPFGERGARLDEQIEYLRQIWWAESSTFSGRFHALLEAGINPLPCRRSIPIWVGGTSPAAVKRAAARSDGWIPVLPAPEAEAAILSFHEDVRAVQRDPAAVGIEAIVFARDLSLGQRRSAAEVAGDCEVWQAAGATHVAVDTMNAGLASTDDHLDYLHAVRARLGR